MGEVVALFNASRWVDRWEALHGFVILGEGPWGPNGAWSPAMREMMPQLDRRPWRERQAIDLLRQQVSSPEAQSAVIDHLNRRKQTRGY